MTVRLVPEVEVVEDGPVVRTRGPSRATWEARRKRRRSDLVARGRTRRGALRALRRLEGAA